MEHNCVYCLLVMWDLIETSKVMWSSMLCYRFFSQPGISNEKKKHKMRLFLEEFLCVTLCIWRSKTGTKQKIFFHCLLQQHTAISSSSSTTNKDLQSCLFYILEISFKAFVWHHCLHGTLWQPDLQFTNWARGFCPVLSNLRWHLACMITEFGGGSSF